MPSQLQGTGMYVDIYAGKLLDIVVLYLPCGGVEFERPRYLNTVICRPKMNFFHLHAVPVFT